MLDPFYSKSTFIVLTMRRVRAPGPISSLLTLFGSPTPQGNRVTPGIEPLKVYGQRGEGSSSHRHVRASPRRSSRNGAAGGPDRRGPADERPGSAIAPDGGGTCASSARAHEMATAAQGTGACGGRRAGGRLRPDYGSWPSGRPGNGVSALMGVQIGATGPGAVRAEPA